MENLYPVRVRASEGSDGVEFQLQVKGYNQHYKITAGAFRYAFNVNPQTDDELLKAFNANHTVIVEIARLHKNFPSHHVIELTDADFRS